MSELPRIIQELELNFRKEYSDPSSSEEYKMIQGFQRFLRENQQNHDLESVLHEASLAIYRLFPFKEISIGIRSPKDDLYRYIVVLGFSPAAKDEHLKLEYTHKEMFDRMKYPWIKISKITDFRYAEGAQVQHNGEEKSFSRPSLLSAKRESMQQMLEADYFDIYLFGEKENVIGWIEVAASRNGMIPSMKTIRWLELFSMIISPIIEDLLQGMRDLKNDNKSS